MAWLSATQALEALGTKQQTLYANVSRGRIRARPDPSDPRRSLYSGEDVARLAQRQAGRRKAEAVATETMRWGDPVLQSTISTVSAGRLYYRGRDAARLSETQALEQIAALLWEGKGVAVRGTEGSAGPSLSAAFAALVARVTTDLPTLGRSPSALRLDAADVLGTVAAALAPGDDALLHVRLAQAWERPAAADFIRRSLVLLADHELNASTFAARVTISTGPALSAAVLSGLATLTGPLHGGAWQGVEALVNVAERLGADGAVRHYLAQGRPLPGFGHHLYPDGDIRAETLFAAFDVPPIYTALGDAGQVLVGERPNVDFAVAALASRFDLPSQAPLIIFALARTVGWLAHALEQAASGALMRPRARYVGPPLEDPLDT